VLVMTLELRRWTNPATKFCEVFGSNALFIFVLSGFLPRVMALLRWPDGTAATGGPHYIQPLRWLHDTAIAPWFADPRAGSLAYALLLLSFYWLIAQQLYKRKIFIKV
jgi:predicted acyltransferase